MAQQDKGAARRAGELEEKVAALEQEIERDRHEMEQKKRQAVEKIAEVDSLLWQVSESLAELTGRRYTVTR
jgi:uncharacterized small protein (DUF1192 family)